MNPLSQTIRYEKTKTQRLQDYSKYRMRLLHKQIQVESKNPVVGGLNNLQSLTKGVTVRFKSQGARNL